MLRCCTHQGVHCLTFPSTFIRNPGDGKESYPTTKNLLIFRTRKKSHFIDLNLPLPKVLFQIKQQFLCNHPMQASFLAVAITVASFFLTSDFICTHVMLIFINRCLLNVVFSMTKALNGQTSPKQNFPSIHLSVFFGKPYLS